MTKQKMANATLAKMVQSNGDTIARYRRGMTGSIDLSVLTRILAALGCTLADVVEGMKSVKVAKATKVPGMTAEQYATFFEELVDIFEEDEETERPVSDYALELRATLWPHFKAKGEPANLDKALGIDEDT
jgi:transcriptional regulator with XRE-family HTH domain